MNIYARIFRLVTSAVNTLSPRRRRLRRQAAEDLRIQQALEAQHSILTTRFNTQMTKMINEYERHLKELAADSESKITEYERRLKELAADSESKITEYEKKIEELEKKLKEKDTPQKPPVHPGKQLLSDLIRFLDSTHKGDKGYDSNDVAAVLDDFYGGIGAELHENKKFWDFNIPAAKQTLSILLAEGHGIKVDMDYSELQEQLARAIYNDRLQDFVSTYIS